MGTELKELQNGFFEALAPGMQRYGFNAVPVDQAFHRPLPVGRWIFHVSFIPHETDFDLTADVAIRVDAVEELVHREDPALLPRDKKRTATIGAELGNIADGRQRRWTIGASADIPIVVAAVIKEFESFGLPYLERFSELETMLAAISSEDRSSWLHIPIHGARFRRAIALAIVLGKTDMARELARQGAKFLIDRKDPGAPALESYTRRIFPGELGP